MPAIQWQRSYPAKQAGDANAEFLMTNDESMPNAQMTKTRLPISPGFGIRVSSFDIDSQAAEEAVFCHREEQSDEAISSAHPS